MKMDFLERDVNSGFSLPFTTSLLPRSVFLPTSPYPFRPLLTPPTSSLSGVNEDGLPRTRRQFRLLGWREEAQRDSAARASGAGASDPGRDCEASSYRSTVLPFMSDMHTRVIDPSMTATNIEMAKRDSAAGASGAGTSDPG